MTRAHLAALLRRHLLEEQSVPPETLARMSDDDTIASCFVCPTGRASRPSAEQMDALIVSCATLEEFMAAADIRKTLPAMLPALTARRQAGRAVPSDFRAFATNPRSRAVPAPAARWDTWAAMAGTLHPGDRRLLSQTGEIHPRGALAP
jgi:hypothetical protein